MAELPFQYPNEEVANRCERSIRTIRQAARAMIRGVITIGQELIDVKTALGHSLFAPWLAAHFNWSYATADNYMTAARAVEEYPQGWDYPLQVLYLLTRQLPQEVKDEIMQTPTTLSEARLIISEHRAAEWKQIIGRTVEINPGEALFEIERALEHEPGLREAAADLMRQHAERFALLSDREPREMLMEAGLTLEEQYPGNLKIRAKLVPFLNDQHVVILIGEEYHVIAAFPRPVAHGIAEASQNAAIRAVCKELNIETAYKT
jgi:hypothetical protein